ncbi:MAG: hypothetical protein M0T78_03395 [Actinomycetota bacterium]|nr:hypothetical protein [Actinomycetota bacterium]
MKRYYSYDATSSLERVNLTLAVIGGNRANAGEVIPQKRDRSNSTAEIMWKVIMINKNYTGSTSRT